MIRPSLDVSVRLMRAIACPSLRKMREMPPGFQAALKRGRGPCAVFLPAEHRNGAALLRCYTVARDLRGLGWHTFVLSPKLTLSQRLRILGRANPDLIVMQGARHPLNRPDHYPHWPIAYDMDDADFHLPHLADAVEAAMPQVAVVLAGSRYIAKWCDGAGARATHVVWTGTPVSAPLRPCHAQRGPVVAWAQTRPMTYVDEADWVRGVVCDLARRRPGVVLRLFDRKPDDDPGFAESFKADGVTIEWVPAQKYRHYLKQFDDVSLGLAPLSPKAPFSRGKSFGKILAYLDRHVPVLATDMGEHGAFFTPQMGVLSNDQALWVDQADRLLGDAKARQDMAKAAFTQFEKRLSSSAAAKTVDQVLRGQLSKVQDHRLQRRTDKAHPEHNLP